MSTLLSVIIPAFNCGPVISRCLGSIDYPDSEIIVVDDGSTDDTAQIVSSYASSHPNVILIKKENGGVSSARNKGIEFASGKYIMFIDADDYIIPNGIGRLIALAEENHIEVLKYVYRTVQESSVIDTSSPDVFNYRVFCNRFEALKRYDIPDYSSIDGIYLRKLIVDNGIVFHTDLYLHEDDVFNGELYCHATKVLVTDFPLYRYISCSSFSSTHSLSREKQRRLIESSYRAASYRYNYVKRFCPEALRMESLKYMRWVCTPNGAISAGYSLKEYKEILRRFRIFGAWPLDYCWIHVSRLDWSWKVRTKKRIKTFMCNHPTLSYFVLFLKKKLS